MGKKPIEVIAKHKDPHHISCYRCDYCYTIFTMESNDDWELCPACKHFADRITRARFNLIKWIRNRGIFPKDNGEANWHDVWR